MKTKKAYSLVLAAVMAPPVPWGYDSSSTDPGTGVAEALDSGTKEVGGGQILRVTVRAQMMGKYDFERTVKEFEEENPDVKVVCSQVGNVDVISSMLEWSQGETDCDLALGGDRSETIPYVANDYVVGFTGENFFNGNFIKDKLIGSFLRSGNADGVQYMTPLLGGVLRRVIDIPIMQEAGYVTGDQTVTAPPDWNEMCEYAKNLAKDGRTDLAIDWGNNITVEVYNTYVTGVSGNLYESDGNILNFTAGFVKNMLQVWQDLVKDGYTTTDIFTDADVNRTNFRAGRIAMHIAPVSRWIETGELLGTENVGVIPVPDTDTHSSVPYIHGTVIPRASENQELAIRFIRNELLQEQFQADFMNSHGRMSPMKAHCEKLDSPYWPIVLDFTGKATTPPLYKDYTKLDTSTQIELQKMLSGDSTVDEFSANMSKFMVAIDLSTGMNK